MRVICQPRFGRRVPLALALSSCSVLACAATVTVNSGGDFSTTACTLRNALLSINQGSPVSACLGQAVGVFGVSDTVLFDRALVHTTIPVDGSSLSITKSALISGSGQALDAGYQLAAVLSITSATVVASRVTIENGRDIHAFGGGLRVNNGSLTLIDSTVSGNTALKGGGIYAVDSSIALVNTTIANNHAYSYGGAIANVRSQVTLANATIVANLADVYGGGFYDGNSQIIVGNTIVLNSSPSEPTKDNLAERTLSGGTPPSFTASFSELGSELQGRFSGNGNVFGGFKGSMQLLPYGGYTLTICPGAGSVGIASGNIGLASFNGVRLNYDQRGYRYPRTLNSLVDMGACQSQADRVFSDVFEALP